MQKQQGQEQHTAKEGLLLSVRLFISEAALLVSHSWGCFFRTDKSSPTVLSSVRLFISEAALLVSHSWGCFFRTDKSSLSLREVNNYGHGFCFPKGCFFLSEAGDTTTQKQARTQQDNTGKGYMHPLMYYKLGTFNKAE